MIEPVTGLSWWTDRIWPEFDPSISAEAYVLKHVVPHVAERWTARPPQLALLGISMGGQGAAADWPTSIPTMFPTVAAISPAIDYQKRIDEGIDPGLEQMYRDAEDARQDTALCTSTRSTGRGTNSSVALRPTSGGTNRPSGCG